MERKSINPDAKQRYASYNVNGAPSAVALA